MRGGLFMQYPELTGEVTLTATTSNSEEPVTTFVAGFSISTKIPLL